MTRRGLIWISPAAIWFVFAFWYTDLGGPLSDDEVTAGIELLTSQGYDPVRLKRLEAFLRNDSGRQFLMVNNIDMNDDPPQMPGFGAEATADDYRDHYMEHMYPQLFKRACHPIFYATGLDIVLDLAGVEGAAASGWDTAALFRYRSRRALLEVITHPDMRDRHDYKIAAMTKTIAYPVEPGLYLSDLRFMLALILGLAAAMADILVYRRR